MLSKQPQGFVTSVEPVDRLEVYSKVSKSTQETSHGCRRTAWLFKRRRYVIWLLEREHVALKIRLFRSVWIPSYPVAVEKLNSSQDVKLASHEELDGQFPGQWRHSMLTGPLVDFLQKLPGSLKQTQMWSQTLSSRNRKGQTGRKWNWALNLIHPQRKRYLQPHVTF